jgi:acyl transferase domain-containing protein
MAGARSRTARVRRRRRRRTRLGRPSPPARADVGAASVGVLFPGHGSQRYGAGRGLYATEPCSATRSTRAPNGWRGSLALDLKDLLGYGDNAAPTAESASQLRRTAHAQPALFAVGYATARLLMSWGSRPRRCSATRSRDHRGMPRRRVHARRTRSCSSPRARA